MLRSCDAIVSADSFTNTLALHDGISEPFTGLLDAPCYLTAGAAGYILAMSIVPGIAGGKTCSRDLKRQPLAVFA